MSVSDETISGFLEIFGLEEQDIQSVSYSNENGNAVIDVFLAPSYEPCPECGNNKVKVKGYVVKKIVHSILTDRPCLIRYHARRYCCPKCGRTYYEKNPFAFKSQKLSMMTVKNILRDLKDANETFSSVARRYNVSPTTVASVFDTHVYIKRKPLPEMLNFDEVYAFKSKGSKYVCVLLDYRTGKPIDLLNSRRQDKLVSYFLDIPPSERNNVKACCFDMYPPYREMTKRFFPNSIGIVDHFHMIEELTRKVERVRIRIMKSYDTGSDQYYLLKKFNWMLYKSSDEKDKYGLIFDINRQRQYNYHFHQLLNYYELLEKLLAIDPQLRKAKDLFDDVADFYKKETIITAEARLNELIQSFRESGIEEMKEFSRTMSKWRTEIINSFVIFGISYEVDKSTGHVACNAVKMTNALIENRNSIIKTLKKNANGYTNWTRFRNRALYVLNKDEDLPLYPLPHPKVVKKG